MGVKASYMQDGPLWALEDGRPMLKSLRPLGLPHSPFFEFCHSFAIPQPHGRLRYTVAPLHGRPSEPGKYVLFKTGHFNGFRIFEDGSCRLQHTNRPHEGRDLDLESFDFTPYTQAFEVRLLHDREELSPCGADAQGGSDASVMCLSTAKKQLQWFESLCCDFKFLLAAEPMFWFLLPSPFELVEPQVWIAKAQAIRQDLADASWGNLQGLSHARVCCVDKRLRPYIGVLRAYTEQLIVEPTLLQLVVNPCESSVSRRKWETNMHWFRQSCKAVTVEITSEQLLVRRAQALVGFQVHKDALGGAVTGHRVAIQSAVTGQILATLDMTGEETADGLKYKMGKQLRHLPFAIICLGADGQIASDNTTWAELGRPETLRVLLKPRVVDLGSALLQALVHNDSAAVKDILKAGQDPNMLVKRVGQLQEPLLLSAVACRRDASVQLLLYGMANPSVAGYDRRTSLHVAALTGQADITHLLLSFAADISAVDFFGQTPLHLAASVNDGQVAQALLAAGADPLVCDVDGETPLRVAAAGDGARCVLLDSCWQRLRPVDVLQLVLFEVCNFLAPAKQINALCGSVNLQLDAWGGSESVTGAPDPEAVLHIHSALSGELLYTLVMDEDKCSCNVLDLVRDAASKSLCAPFYCFDALPAAASAILQGSETWCELGCPANLQVIQKPQVWHLSEDLFAAIEEGDVAGVQSILSAGQDPNTVLQLPAIHHAVRFGSPLAVDLLLKGQANPNFFDHRGYAPLHLAIVYRDFEMTFSLLSCGADPLAADPDDGTPFSWAPRGAFTSMCVGFCYNRVKAKDILIRHMREILPACGCSVLLQAVSRAFARQTRFWDARGGGVDQPRVARPDVDGLCCADAQVQAKKRKLALSQAEREIVAHNSSVAKCLRDIRFKGSVVAPVTTKACLPGRLSLRDLGLEAMLSPMVRDGYVQRSVMPEKPLAWPAVCPEVIDHMRLLNAHPRDARLQFDAPSHTYFWDGQKVGISTTGLLHQFSQGFNAEEAIAKMQSSRNWPRPGYLKPYVPNSVRLALGKLGYADQLLALLSARPLSEEHVCDVARSLVCNHPADKDLIHGIAKSPEQIKLQWKRHADTGASQGTWMHASFECLLNGGFISTSDEELRLFQKFFIDFTAVHPGAQVFRTEWAIFATEEDLAGSIDLALQSADGSLILVDWKRTKALASKDLSFGKMMKSCLGRVPDSTLWHYRLQLNIYRGILEKYYDCKVSSMFIVGCNPDNGFSPFVERVHFLPEETAAVMASLCRSCGACGIVDALGGKLGAEERQDIDMGSKYSRILKRDLVQDGSLRCVELESRVLFNSVQFVKEGRIPVRDRTFACNDCLGGGQPQDVAATWLGLYLLGWPVGSGIPADQRLRDFQIALRPLWTVLSTYKHLFWMLPNPLCKKVDRGSFSLRMSASSFFLRLLQTEEFEFLELALYIFFWPELKSRPFVADMIFVSGCFRQAEECGRHMAGTIHFLHICWLSSTDDCWRQHFPQRCRSLQVLKSLKERMFSEKSVRGMLCKRARACVCGLGLLSQRNFVFDMEAMSRGVGSEVKAVMAECSTVLASHKQLYHLLLPSNGGLSASAWRLRIYSARFFLLLLQEQAFEFLELALYMFHWPDIEKHEYVAPLFFQCAASEPRCVQCRRLANVMHTLHCLSLHSAAAWEEPDLSHREQSFCLMKTLFQSELVRANLIQTVGAHEAWDACGGASQDGPSLEARLEEEAREMEDMVMEGTGGPMEDEPIVEPPATKEEQADDEVADDGEQIFGDELPESTWKALKKRRLFPGALTSNEDFASHFQNLTDVNAVFQARPGEAIVNPDTILHVVQQRQQGIKALYPRFSKHMVRLCTAAVSIFCMRISDMSIREHALMLWIVEGGDFLRFHEGDCYMLHPSGAFQRYKGVPADSSRLCHFFLELEGVFRRLPQDTLREEQSLLQAISQQWQAAGEDDLRFGERCVRAAVSNVGEPLLKQRGGEDGLGVEADVQNWRFHVARVVLQLKVRLARELTEEKLLHYMVEWCETPKKAARACCFDDCCMEYSDDAAARQVGLTGIDRVGSMRVVKTWLVVGMFFCKGVLLQRLKEKLGAAGLQARDCRRLHSDSACVEGNNSARCIGTAAEILPPNFLVQPPCIPLLPSCPSFGKARLQRGPNFHWPFCWRRGPVLVLCPSSGLVRISSD